MIAGAGRTGAGIVWGRYSGGGGERGPGTAGIAGGGGGGAARTCQDRRLVPAAGTTRWTM
ncbi:hypothetical protein FJK98_26775 [Micromonospora sp. HM134]|nr:hypothetical protein FJK98_26775 [Micromonospora sp. HM134]